MLEIITYNPTLERVGASNRYISHGQSSSLKASFEIELGPLDFNMVSEQGYPLQLVPQLCSILYISKLKLPPPCLSLREGVGYLLFHIKNSYSSLHLLA
jgi:hypothetical protein